MKRENLGIFSQYKIPKRVEGGRGVAHLGKFPKNRLQHIHHISHRRCRHFLWSNFAPHAKIALSCLWSKVYKYDKYAEAWTRRKPRNLTTQRSTRWFFSLLESRDCASESVLHRCTSFAPRCLGLDRFTCSGHLIVEDQKTNDAGECEEYIVSYSQIL